MRTCTTFFVSALLITAAATTGCSSSDDKEPSAKHTTAPKTSKEDQFLGAVHKAEFASWASNAPTDAELLDYPQRWCDSLADGHSVKYTFDADGGLLYPIGDAWGTKKEDANQLLLLGVKAYCPDMADRVTEELRDDGVY